MKICIVSQVENWRGGIQQYSQNYAEAMIKKIETCVVGYHAYFPIFLYPGDTQNITKQSRPWKESVPVYNILKYYSLFSVFRAYRLIKNKLKSDVVDIQWCTTFHAPILIPLVVLLRYFSKVSVVMTVHNVLPHENRFFDKKLCKIIYTLSNRLVVHSEKMKKDLMGIFGISAEKISIIPHGICLEKGRVVSRRDAKKRFGITEERVLLFFGLIRKYKGLDLLLAAFDKIKDDFDVALLIAGDFVEGRDRYEKLIEKFGIKSKTYIHSRYIKDEEVPGFFSAADLLIQPYLSFSGQSGVPPTAYSHSTPIIASNVGGLPEIVRNNQTGLVIEANNIDQLAEAIRSFLKKPEMIEEYGANGKRFFETELSWESIAEKMFGIYSMETGHPKKK